MKALIVAEQVHEILKYFIPICVGWISLFYWSNLLVFMVKSPYFARRNLQFLSLQSLLLVKSLFLLVKSLFCWSNPHLFLLVKVKPPIVPWNHRTNDGKPPVPPRLVLRQVPSEPDKLAPCKTGGSNDKNPTLALACQSKILTILVILRSKIRI